MNKPIFTQKAMKKLRTPDDMEKYVQVTNPGMWVILGACAALLLGLLAWGFLGTVSVTIQTRGVYADGKMFCLVSPAEYDMIRIGDKANIGGTSWTVTECNIVPITRRQAVSFLGSEYLANLLMKEDMAYQVFLSPDESVSWLLEDDPDMSDVPFYIVITAQSMRPIDLIM